MVVFSGYVVGGVAASARMLKHGRDGRAPLGLAVHRKDSYTPEGQRLLATFLKWWVFRFPLVLLGVALVGGLLCRVTGWTQPAP
jgi:hypothetical protein